MHNSLGLISALHSEEQSCACHPAQHALLCLGAMELLGSTGFSHVCLLRATGSLHLNSPGNIIQYVISLPYKAGLPKGP